MKTDVLQFGTSRFLQAHADLFFSEARVPRSVTVVQTSGNPERAKRLPALADPDGIPIKIRGLLDGQVIDKEQRVTSLKQAFSTHTDWDAVCAVFKDVDFVVSNTSDIGFAARPEDMDAILAPTASFPAKLTHLLFMRYHAGSAPPLLLPTELLPNNGHALKSRLLEIAETALADAGFRDWLEQMVAANSIVDRIVSEPLEPAGAIAEPYALWAIEAAPGVRAPCDHPSIQIVPSLEGPERLKLHILNLGHTIMADWWLQDGRPEGQTVLDVMQSERRGALEHILISDVLPGFAARGLEEDAKHFITATLERFSNPFLRHLISDIAGNHSEKLDRRIAAFFDWASTGGVLSAPSLSAILDRNRS
ncbi:mannitol dehydrogenase family protein [Rhodophyticola sp. CCM32]|nr:mannitol dehydrogenase family protein [Rhodophyticola sp. CCM32]